MTIYFNIYSNKKNNTMKYLKKFEKWSPKFNRTLQGASALAVSTNKGFGKVSKDIEAYANRSISNEEFEVEDSEGSVSVIVHDPKFILEPIQNYKFQNREIGLKYWLAIPVLIKNNTSGRQRFTQPADSSGRKMLIVFSKNGDLNLVEIDGSIRMGDNPLTKNSLKVRFKKRTDLENFLAMAIQAITSSPENDPTPSPFAPTKPPSEKIIEEINSIIISNDIRKFLM